MNVIYVIYDDRDTELFKVNRYLVYTSNDLPYMIKLLNKLVYRTMEVAAINTLEGTKGIYGVRNHFRYSIYKLLYNVHTGAKIGEPECIRSVNVMDTWGFSPEDPIEQYRPPPRKRVKFADNLQEKTVSFGVNDPPNRINYVMDDDPFNIPGFNYLPPEEPSVYFN